MPDYLDDLRLAHVLADAADAATMDRFKALDLKVETKPDMTPVSEADKAAMAIPQCVGGPYIPQRELARKGPDYKPAALVT